MRFRILLLATLFTVVACDLSQAAGSKTTFTRSAIGCQDREVFDTMLDLVASGDEVASKNYMITGVITGRCATFQKGETVYVMKTKGFLSLINKVRRPGEIKSFYVIGELLNRR